jgi:carbohydrate-selective porin OprB
MRRATSPLAPSAVDQLAFRRFSVGQCHPIAHAVSIIHGLFQAVRARARGHRNTTTFVVSLTILAMGIEIEARADAVDDWLSGDYATGTWGGIRDKVIEAGVTPEVTYTTDILTLLDGGIDKGNSSSYAGRAEAALDFDLKKLFGRDCASI